MRTHPNDDENWKLFRTIIAAPVGTFANDTPWADGATIPGIDQVISIPRDEEHQTMDFGRILLEIVLTTANAAAIVPRGAMTFDLQAIEVVDTAFTKLYSDTLRSNVLPTHAMDSVIVAAIPQRKAVFEARGVRQMAIRISNIAGTPVTAAELHMLYRLE